MRNRLWQSDAWEEYLEINISQNDRNIMCPPQQTASPDSAILRPGSRISVM